MAMRVDTFVKFNGKTFFRGFWHENSEYGSDAYVFKPKRVRRVVSDIDGRKYEIDSDKKDNRF